MFRTFATHVIYIYTYPYYITLLRINFEIDNEKINNCSSFTHVRFAPSVCVPDSLWLGTLNEQNGYPPVFFFSVQRSCSSTTWVVWKKKWLFFFFRKLIPITVTIAFKRFTKKKIYLLVTYLTSTDQALSCLYLFTTKKLNSQTFSILHLLYVLYKRKTRDWLI